jgi:4-amino-4-deoxy-L-arabinose transferase-like glycosyltransferase
LPTEVSHAKEGAMPQGLRHQGVIVAVAASILFFQLGAARLWDRDEPRNARCSVEMLERNDWVVPFFNGEIRTHKPVLLYWLIMSAYSVFGVNEFAARFWSAALGVGTVLCTYHLGSRLFDRRSGLWAALALAPALMFDVASRAATPDGCLIFTITASLMAYVLFAFPAPAAKKPPAPTFPSTLWPAVMIYALVGLAVLAKGPVGFVMPVGIMAASLFAARWLQTEGYWQQRLLHAVGPQAVFEVAWQMRPLTALLVVGLVAVPWYAWVGYRTNGEFLIGFFWDHNVRRATEAMEGHRGSALWFYPATLLIGFFPASVFEIPSLLEAGKRLRRGDRHSAALLFCLMWLLLFVGVFSLAKTKLPSYVTPCYPAIALLVGNFVHRWTAGELAISPLWPRWSVAWLVLVGLVVAPALYWATGRYLPGEQWLCVIGGVLLLGGIVALSCDVGWGAPYWAATTAFASGALFSALLFGWGAAAADRHQQSHLLVQAVQAGGPAAEVAAWRCLEPSWVFYLREEITELPKPRAVEGSVSPEDQAVHFLAANKARFLIVKRHDLPLLQGKLPPGIQEVATVPVFLNDEELVVLGHAARAEKRAVARQAADSHKSR